MALLPHSISRHAQSPAERIAQQAADMLHASVTLVNHQGLVVGAAGAVCHIPGEPNTPLRIRFEFDGESYDALIAQPTQRHSENSSSDEEQPSPRLAGAILELIARQVMLSARLPNQREMKNKFIHNLLRGASEDEESLVREGQMLGMDLMRPRAVLLIDAANYILSASAASAEYDEEYAWRRAQRVVASVVGFFSLPNDTICAYIGDGEIAVLKASGAHDLAAWAGQTGGGFTNHSTHSSGAPSTLALRHRLAILPVEPASAEGDQAPEPVYGASWADLGALKRASAALLSRLRHDTGAQITIGVGRYHPGIHALADSYQDARAALSLGRRFHGPNQAHSLDALGVAAFVGVADERTKIDLAIHLLSPLDHEAELLDTLDVFFTENCSPSTTASHLNIHRNTLGYRLDKITALTGLDPRRFDDAVQIRLALTLRALHGSRTPTQFSPTERASL